MKTLNEINSSISDLILQAIKDQVLSKDLEYKVTEIILEAYQMGFEEGHKEYDSLPF